MTPFFLSRYVLTYEWVIMQKVVQPLGPESKSSHDLAGLDGFVGVGYGAIVDEIHHAIREHLRVDAEITMLAQFAEDGIRDGTNTCSIARGRGGG